MGTITQDFEFERHSEPYGRFLTIIHAEGLKIVEVSKYYPYSSSFFLSVDSPEHIATLLKLTFGKELRVRPQIKIDIYEYLDNKIDNKIETWLTQKKYNINFGKSCFD